MVIFFVSQIALNILSTGVYSNCCLRRGSNLDGDTGIGTLRSGCLRRPYVDNRYGSKAVHEHLTGTVLNFKDGAAAMFTTAVTTEAAAAVDAGAIAAAGSEFSVGAVFIGRVLLKF